MYAKTTAAAITAPLDDIQDEPVVFPGAHAEFVGLCLRAQNLGLEADLLRFRILGLADPAGRVVWFFMLHGWQSQQRTSHARLRRSAQVA